MNGGAPNSVWSMQRAKEGTGEVGDFEDENNEPAIRGSCWSFRESASALLLKNQEASAIINVSPVTFLCRKTRLEKPFKSILALKL